MDTRRFTLMTLAIDRDIARNALTRLECFQLAANAGIPFVDVVNVEPGAVSEYLMAMNATGVRVACYISSCSFFTGENADVTALNRNMRVAKELGAKLFMIVPYKYLVDRQTAKKIGRTKVLDLLISGFRLAVETAKQYGLTVCFETTPADEICLSGTADCLYVLKHVSELGLVFDSANMLSHGDMTMAAYEILRDLIIHVHLKDVSLTQETPLPFEEYTADGRRMNAAMFGLGEIPVKELYIKMLQDGYQGLFAIEYQAPNKTASPMQEHAAQLERYLDYMKKDTY